MRCRDEYRALISKINIEKAKYAEEEQKVNDDLEASIQITTEKMKKWNKLLFEKTQKVLTVRINCDRMFA